MARDESALPISSSTPPEFLPGALECYRGVLEYLNQQKVPFAIAGAFAFHRHTGIWRTTKDLDLFLEPKFVVPALEGLQKLGFKTHIEDPIWLAKALRGEHFVDLITGLGNAILIVNAEWIARSLPHEVFGVRCRVLAAEEAIASKIFISRRERFDGADVAHLIRASGKHLDWDHLQQLVEPHWEMMLWSLVFFRYVYPAHTEVVPRTVWDSLMLRLHDHIRYPNPAEPFRGTLIDPLMFAIDVDEWGERDLYKEYRQNHPYPLQATLSSDHCEPARGDRE
jgi:Nucleotidyl transferase of unknown function (DUF2204)